MFARVVLASALAAMVVVVARPNRFGHSDREERHMFPAVSTSPLDPAWSPDGRWIAFSMRGDVWKVPVYGGVAVAVTSGPNYYFEPAWSPDGKRLAVSMDVGGNLEIGLVSSDGGGVETVSSNPKVDLQPAWSHDGQALFFASARHGGWRIIRHDLATGKDSVMTTGVQPSISPDGKSMAYSQGGLRVLNLETLASRLVREEETEYRVRPSWTPDGKNILYVTEDKGSNDIRIISADGGDPIELTVDNAHHEMSPTPSPDGKQLAFVGFRAGVPTLYVTDIAGGRKAAWREVRITARRPVAPTGRVHVRVVGPDNQPMPARVYVDASDGRSYSPDSAFHRAMMVTDRHYFHINGDADLDLPVGRATIEAVRGFEYTPQSITVNVVADTTQRVTIALKRLEDMPARGWYSGDGHVHDLHQGFGQTHESFFLQLVAEDIHMSNALIHMDGTRLMGRWEDLTGQLSPLSTPTHLLQYAQEFRGSLGHIGMIGTREYILPFTAGARGTAYSQPSLERWYLTGARAQGGLAGFMHPYQSTPRTPTAAASTLIALDVALGHGDYYDIGALWSDEIGSAHFYGRLLNAGFRIAATGGTDNFSDVFRDPPPGSDRTYARVDGPLTMHSWMQAIKQGRTFFSTGPLLMLDVEGKQPGGEIAVAANAPPTLAVTATVTSITPLDSLQIIVNGDVVHTVAAIDRSRIAYTGRIAVPRGGWVAARAIGPHSRFIGDDYAFAQTSPVYVVRGGRPYTKLEDVQFLSQTIDAIWARVERGPWRSDGERDAFKRDVDTARATYARIAAGGAGRRTDNTVVRAPDSATRAALWLTPSHSEWTKAAPAVSQLRFETTKGVFVLELVRDWGPIGADRVYNLARLGYYDNTRFHRVNANYIAQWGLHGNPLVNAAWNDQYLADDSPRSDNRRGTFAIAMKGVNPRTRNVQVYINLGDNERNNSEPFTVLGTVVEGMSVVESLYAGYGENSGSGVRQGRQGPLAEGGNPYMDKMFPLLDHITRVTVRTIQP